MNPTVAVIYPPGWVRYNTVVPIGITTLVGGLREAGIAAFGRDLELSCFSFNTDPTQIRKLALDRLCTRSPLDDHVENASRVDDWHIAQLRGLLRAEDATTWAFSVMGTRQVVPALILARAGAQTGKRILFGGHYSRDHAEELLQVAPYIDAVVAGDGRAAITGLATLPEGSWGSLPNVIYRSDSRIVRTPDIEESAEDMAAPCFEGLELDRYRQRHRAVYGSDGDELIVQYIAVVGCAHRCVFCGRSSQHSFSAKTPEKVASELMDVAANANTSFVKVEGNELNPTKQYLTELTEALLETNASIRWGCYLRAVDLDRDLLAKLHASGCRFVRWGLESGAQSFHDRMNKGYRVGEMEEILHASHDVGLLNIAVFLIGVPGETAQEIRLTQDFIRRNRAVLHAGKINPFGLAPGSDLVLCPERHGIRLHAERAGAYDEHPGLRWADKRRQNHRHFRAVALTLSEIGVGQTGLSSDLVFTALIRSGNRQEALDWLRTRHDYLLRPDHYASLSWRLYHHGEPMDADVARIVRSYGAQSGVEHD